MPLKRPLDSPRPRTRNAPMRTETTLQAIERELQENLGDRLEACRRVGVSLIFLNQWCKDDKLVAGRIQEAERVGVQGLYSAAVKRAVHGVDKDVYYKGCVVGQQTEYSDGLLSKLLAAKLPEFSNTEGSNTNVTVNVANVMPRAATYEDWLEMRTKTLAPPDPQIADAEFTEVREGVLLDIL